MKKILICLFTMIILSFSASYATLSMDNVKYISAETANEMWNVDVRINERTGIIEIKHEEKTIFMQLGRKIIKQEDEMNRLFMNIEGYLFKGEKNVDGYPFILNEKLYIPSNALYSLIHAENEYGDGVKYHVHHVSIYLGNGQLLESVPGKGVIVRDIPSGERDLELVSIMNLL